jgi:hypothetical protein
LMPLFIRNLAILSPIKAPLNNHLRLSLFIFIKNLIVTTSFFISEFFSFFKISRLRLTRSFSAQGTNYAELRIY